MDEKIGYKGLHISLWVAGSDMWKNLKTIGYFYYFP